MLVVAVQKWFGDRSCEVRCWRWWGSGVLRGVLMGNRGEGRPTRDYLVEGAVIVYIRIFCLHLAIVLARFGVDFLRL